MSLFSKIGGAAFVAGARVNGADGAALVARGGVSARTGAGRYTFTLDQAIDPLERIVVVTTELADAAAFVTHTSDTVIDIDVNLTTGAGATAADATFNVMVFQISGGAGA